MENGNLLSRRATIKSSLFGLFGVSISNVLFAKTILPINNKDNLPEVNADRYPAIDETIVAEVVAVSHFDIDRLKVLVNTRPELVRATWDWGFGDWETAIGAASHVGRKDIVKFLLTKGARPDIFTFAMLGAYETVKSMIEVSAGVQRISGPHGISLLQHVKNGLDNNNQDGDAQKLISYLESLGDADSQKYLPVEETDKQKYLGDYKYGDKDEEGFSIKLNMKKLLTLGKLGRNGGAIYKIGENQFTYNGAPSVAVSFAMADNKVVSLTITEPDLILTAKKI